MSLRLLVGVGALVAATFVMPTAAQAAGVVTTQLPAQAASTLRRDIAAARASDVRPFVTVGDLVQNAPKANAHARGRKAPLALTFARLGAPGVLPMLELVAFGAPTGVPEGEWPGIRRDLVEALGLIHDARALPALLAILDDRAEDAKTTRTAAEAVARFGTPDAETHLLRALDGASPERERAVLAGMGECRTARIVTTLASHVRTAKDDATARAGVKSLGRAGNAWAWKTEADQAQAARVREDAAGALVDAFVQWTGEVRSAASNALMVVDADVTPARIESAKSAHPELAAELDALAARFARNPTRTR